MHLFGLNEFECLVTLDVFWPEWSLRLWSFSFEIMILEKGDCLCLAWQIIIERMIELLLLKDWSHVEFKWILLSEEKKTWRETSPMSVMCLEKKESPSLFLPDCLWCTQRLWFLDYSLFYHNIKDSLMICEWLLSITFTLESCLWCKTRKEEEG